MTTQEQNELKVELQKLADDRASTAIRYLELDGISQSQEIKAAVEAYLLDYFKGLKDSD